MPGVLVVATAVVVVVAVAALTAYRHWVRRSLPQTRGLVSVDGVLAPTSLSRDANGLVHVQAASMADAAFAMGFAHAQDRLWQLELNRRVASGRISEFAGPDGLVADRFMRRIGLHRIAQAEAERVEGDTKDMLTAYTAGINAVIQSSRPLPLEFRLLKLTPREWTTTDCLACFKLLALALSTNWDNELQRLDLLRQVGPVQAAKLDLIYPDANPTILTQTATDVGPHGEDSALAMFQETARWIPALGGGSNSWVVAGARSSTGRPLLCNDPHLPPAVPSPWYQAHIKVDGDFEATGVTFAGLPFVILGHNAHVAWGCTNSFADCQDLVIEDFEDASLDRYRSESGPMQAQMCREVISVKDASDEVEEVVITRHGPIVERISDPARGMWRGLALQWTALVPGDAAGSVLRVQRAQDGAGFRAAFHGFDAPAQNVIWADTNGHIGYFLCGRVPVRRRAASGLPVAGWNGDALWARLLRPEEMPAGMDPTEGFIVTANNRIVGNDFPHYIATDYMNGYRALRIGELLGESGPLTPARMAEIQMDTVCPPACTVSRLMRDLRCNTPSAERLRRLLAQWDGRMDANRIEPTVYSLFMEKLAEYSLSPLCSDAWKTVTGTNRSHPVFGYPGNLIGRLTPMLLQHWSDDDDAFFDNQTRWTEVAIRALETVAQDSRHKRRWGKLHELPLRHPLAVNFASRRIFNLGSIRVSGDADTVLATSHVPSEPGFETKLLAPSWRQIVDVGEWDAATAIHYPGQSGQPASRHYHDLVRRWQRNDPLPLAWSDAAVRARVKRTLTLQPRPVEPVE